MSDSILREIDVHYINEVLAKMNRREKLGVNCLIKFCYECLGLYQVAKLFGKEFPKCNVTSEQAIIMAYKLSKGLINDEMSESASLFITNGVASYICGDYELCMRSMIKARHKINSNDLIDFYITKSKEKILDGGGKVAEI